MSNTIKLPQVHGTNLTGVYKELAPRRQALSPREVAHVCTGYGAEDAKRGLSNRGGGAVHRLFRDQKLPPMQPPHTPLPPTAWKTFLNTKLF